MQNIWRKYNTINPLTRGLVWFIALALALSFIFVPKPQAIDLGELSFSTTAQSRLYFHNVRSYFYRVDRFSKKPMAIHRLKRRTETGDSSSLNFSIAHYPGAEQAFIISELGAQFKGFKNAKLVFQSFDLELLENLNGEDHYRIAAKVYSSILANEVILLQLTKENLVELFTDKSARLDVTITLKDYFKLVGKS
jgi:hypothetical protein